MSSSDDMELKKEAAPARRGGVEHWLVGDYDWGYLCKPQVGTGCGVFGSSSVRLAYPCPVHRHAEPLCCLLPPPARLQWPWCAGARRRSPPQFFGRDAWLGLLTAAVMGLQHAMAMLAGLTTVPYLLGVNAFSVSAGQHQVPAAAAGQRTCWFRLCMQRAWL